MLADNWSGWSKRDCWSGDQGAAAALISSPGPPWYEPGAVPDEAARIDVPVLLATGERDVCHPPAEEVATLKSATDISVLVVPRMAHMHNFATTRTLLLERLDEFVTHVTRTTAARGTSR